MNIKIIIVLSSLNSIIIIVMPNIKNYKRWYQYLIHLHKVKGRHATTVDKTKGTPIFLVPL